MIEVILNDRLGKKVRVKCNPDDTVGDLKKLAAAQLGTRPDKIRIQKWYTGALRYLRALSSFHCSSECNLKCFAQYSQEIGMRFLCPRSVQGPHYLAGLRNPRRHGPRIILPLEPRWKIRVGF